MQFMSNYDEALFLSGPPSLFVVDPEGRLKIDPERSREIWLKQGPLVGREVGHYGLTDRVTGLRLYVVTTHPTLALAQPRAEATPFPDGETAMAWVRAQWAAV